MANNINIDVDDYVSDIINLLESVTLSFQDGVIEDSCFMEESDDVTNALIRIPPLKLKRLPSDFKYVHLDPDGSYPIIISSFLTTKMEHKLVNVIQIYRSAIDWTLDDMKGIDPSIFHKASILRRLPKLLGNSNVV